MSTHKTNGHDPQQTSVVICMHENDSKVPALRDRLQALPQCSDVLCCTDKNALHEALDERQVGFLIVEYAWALQADMRQDMLRAKSRHAMMVMVYSPFFSRESLLQLTQAEASKADFVTSSSQWDLEVFAFISKMTFYLQVERERNTLQKTCDELRETHHELSRTMKHYEDHIRHMEDKIAKISMYDQETQLHSREQFIVFMKTGMEEAFRYKDNLSLLYLKIDNKEEILKEHGTQGMQFVVKEVAQVIKHSLRVSDIATLNAQSDTFWILHRRLPPSKVREVTTRLKNRIEIKTFFYQDQHTIYLQLSGGVSSAINYYKNTFDANEMFKRADVALMNAQKKKGGAIVFYA